MPRPRTALEGDPEETVKTSISLKRRTLKKGVQKAKEKNRSLSNYVADRIEEDAAPAEQQLRP